MSGSLNHAASSRAMPRCDWQSGRFGVISRSNTVSPGGSTSFIAVPSAGLPERMSRPLWSVPMPISSGEHIMPSDDWPRIFDCLISKFPGRTAPGSATRTRLPASQLFAPQTMVFTPPAGPTSTVQTESLSAFGCLARVRISPTTTLSNFGAPVLATPSTSKPRNVIARVSSSTEASSWT